MKPPVIPLGSRLLDLKPYPSDSCRRLAKYWTYRRAMNINRLLARAIGDEGKSRQPTPSHCSVKGLAGETRR